MVFIGNHKPGGIGERTGAAIQIVGDAGVACDAAHGLAEAGKLTPSM